MDRYLLSLVPDKRRKNPKRNKNKKRTDATNRQDRPGDPGLIMMDDELAKSPKKERSSPL